MSHPHENGQSLTSTIIEATKPRNKKKRQKNKSKKISPVETHSMEVDDEVEPAAADLSEIVADGESDAEADCPPEAYIPGRSRPLREDEELVMDKLSYRMFHEFQLESACLSFDVLLDNLGSDRSVEVNGEAVSACLVSGTQAPPKSSNNLVVMKLDNMIPFRSKVKENGDGDDNSEDEDDDESSSDEDLDADPELEVATIRHNGAVNRVKGHQCGGRNVVAAWSEVGTISIWDLTRPLTAVNDSAVMSQYTRSNESPSPLYTHKGHRCEGFALDWSPHPNFNGHLASGDMNGKIFHWTPRTSGWAVSRTPYTGHSNSVEDIQWSSTEPTVFISVSSDQSIRVWDTRSPPSSGSMITVPDAHPADVNVVSWNKLQAFNILTGGDDGSLRIWDLRLVTAKYNSSGGSDEKGYQLPAYTQVYNFHTKPITSVEWHPTDVGVFVAASDDDQVTIWDSTLEQADERSTNNDGETESLPVELLFIHCGQTEIKEVHWHPQIPGLLIVTSLNGFNVFRTCNV